MPKNPSKTNIPIDYLADFSTERDLCEGCEKQIDDNSKLLVWDDEGNVHGYACIFCKTIYDENDELTKVSTGESETLYEA